MHDVIKWGVRGMREIKEAKITPEFWGKAEMGKNSVVMRGEVRNQGCCFEHVDFEISLRYVW